jgi:hypothetical protein
MKNTISLGHLTALATVALFLQACSGNPLGPSEVKGIGTPVVGPSEGGPSAGPRTSDIPEPTSDVDAKSDLATPYAAVGSRIDAAKKSDFNLGPLTPFLPNPNNGGAPNLVPQLPLAPVDPGLHAIDTILNGQDLVTAISDALKGPVGIPLRAVIVEAKRNAGPGEPFPPSLVAQLIQLGVREDLVRRARWSRKWGAVDTVFTKAKDAVTLQELIVYRNPSAVTNPTPSDLLMHVHELEHFAQYDRMGLDLFAAEYTIDSQKYENEANAAASRAATRLPTLNQRPVPPGGATPVTTLPIAPVTPQPTSPVPVTSVYYSFCRTFIGDSPVIMGGLPPNANCWIPNAWGMPVWGKVIGFYR